MKKTPLLFFLMCVFLHADIDDQIEAIQKASANERFKLMNEFKKEIVQMQERERLHAISKLRTITKSKQADKTFKDLQKKMKSRDMHIEKRKRKEHRGRRDHEGYTQESIENGTNESIENETEDHVENETENHIENEIEDHEENEHDDD